MSIGSIPLSHVTRNSDAQVLQDSPSRGAMPRHGARESGPGERLSHWPSVCAHENVCAQRRSQRLHAGGSRIPKGHRDDGMPLTPKALEADLGHAKAQKP